MTSALITQNTERVLRLGESPNLRASASTERVLHVAPAALRASASTAAVLRDGLPAIRVSATHVCVLYEPSPITYVSQSHARVLAASGVLQARVTQTVLQVLYDITQLSPIVEVYDPVSNYLFPTLKGLAWNIVKKPKFSTVISPHVSGREVRVSNYSYPLWEWDMSYEFLRADSHNELQTLMGFFLQRAGSFDTFLYKDADENNVVVNGSLGAGDGALTKFTFYKTYAGFTEPIGYVDYTTLHIYFTVGGITTEQLSGWTFISPNQVNFTFPPPIGTTITASYTWYYRVRFNEDAQDYSNFMYQLWELKKLTLQSVKP